MDQTAPSARMPKTTPANVPSNRQEMKPLPLRVARSQYARLVAARSRTGISIQEHVRRAIDAYLVATEREAIELGHMFVARATPASGTRAMPGRARPAVAKVTKR
jgi:hypothetical protein